MVFVNECAAELGDVGGAAPERRRNFAARGRTVGREGVDDGEEVAALAVGELGPAVGVEVVELFAGGAGTGAGMIAGDGVMAVSRVPGLLPDELECVGVSTGDAEHDRKDVGVVGAAVVDDGVLEGFEGFVGCEVADRVLLSSDVFPSPRPPETIWTYLPRLGPSSTLASVRWKSA